MRQPSAAAPASGPANQSSRVNDSLAGLIEDSKTVGFYQKKIGIDPVVGWLVCLQGPERGRDYRIHAGQNFIGRSYEMDIIVSDDEQVSRERHCAIIFDPSGNEFYLVPGQGTQTTLNNNLLIDSAALKEGDRIQAGGSTFVFVPFSQEGHTWQ